MKIVRYLRRLLFADPPVEVRTTPASVALRPTQRPVSASRPIYAPRPTSLGDGKWQMAVKAGAPTAARARWRIEMIGRHCESGLERAFAAAFFSIPCREHRDIIPPCYVEDIPARVARAKRRIAERVPDQPQILWVLIPQVHFSIRYRLDFVLARITARDNLAMVAVECDGEWWHDARRDEERDDFVLDRHDLRTLRFPGERLVRDAAGCAVEAMKALV